MTLPQPTKLRREAGVLKMRAARLRVFGDTDDRWQATLLFRHAADKELEALSAQGGLSENEQTGVRIEACGLFVEARDPVRAAEQWLALPRRVVSASAVPERLQKPYQELVGEFAGDWRALMKLERPGAEEAFLAKLRALVERFPGVAELWGMLATRTPDPAEADRAERRMLDLDPTLKDRAEAFGHKDAITRVLMRPLAVEMSPEEPEGDLLLDQVNRIAGQFGNVLRSFVEAGLGHAVELLPLSAKAGSFVFDIAAWGLPPHAMGELDRVLTEAPEKVDGLIELASLLQENRVRLRVTCDPAGSSALVIDAERCRRLLQVATVAALSKVDSKNIPQADELSRVFRVVEMVAGHEEVSARTLGISSRQVSCYVRAAKILGFLGESGEITAAGRLIARLDEEDRLRTTVVHFESSICGEAWIRWSKGKTLCDVEPDDVFAFLEECVPGLEKSTAQRRGQTLIAWYRELIVHHYASEPHA